MPDKLQIPEQISLHGGSTPPGLDDATGRFGRMFALLPKRDLSPEAIEGLVTIIAAQDIGLGDNPTIPAGYTYLGQFIDHDITFDPTSELGRPNDPRTLVNFRTPRLDLDSLYGSGPKGQPFLYDWDDKKPDPGVRLLVGQSPGEIGEPPVDDLPRNEQDRALIGDPRNDVHLIIAQLHLLFIRFHNKVVEKVRADSTRRGTQLDSAALFAQASQIVRWHYQWIVIHDFLAKVAGPSLDDVLDRTLPWPAVRRRFFHWDRAPYIPVEFSGAAFRFGHSMVRDNYLIRVEPLPAPAGDLSDALGDFVVTPLAGALLFSGQVKAKLFPKGVPGGPETHLSGFRSLPPALQIQWSLFFNLDDSPDLQFSRRIDAGLAVRLSRIPAAVSDVKELPRANLRRGQALGLPAGRDVALTMGAEPLTDKQLHLAADAPIDQKLREQLLAATPLWYYVLCEAEALNKGEFLGPVGGAIVAEVLVGLIEGDPESFLRQTPRWTPAQSAELLGRDPATAHDFTMPDLVRFVES